MCFWQKELKMVDNGMVFEVFTYVRKENVANFSKGFIVI
jgi:hypothetical protein